MRIGLVAPPWVPVPPTQVRRDGVDPRQPRSRPRRPRARGGAVHRGHLHLSRWRSGGCSTSRSRRSASASPRRRTCWPPTPHSFPTCWTFIHDHTALGPLVAPALGGAAPASACVPLALTLHGPPTDAVRALLLQHTAQYAALVAISQAQQRSAPELPITHVIHHGIDLDLHKPGPGRRRVPACSWAGCPPTRASTGRSTSPDAPACRW